jgi:class 3 adenylate cyclase
MRPPVEFARNGDVMLAYQAVGDGHADLLFMNGWFSNLDLNWENPHLAAMLRALGEGRRLIVTDRRGWGLSERFSPTDVPPLESLADDLAVVLDACGSQRPVIFASFECATIALLFAAAHPERVAGLIVVNSFVSWTASAETPWMPTRAWWDEFFRGDLEPRWGRSWQLDDVPPEDRDWYARIQRGTCTPSTIAAEERRFGELHIADVLPAVRVPTLVMSDDREHGWWLPTARLIESSVPEVRRATFRAASSPFWYPPAADAIVRETEAFIEDLNVEEAVLDRVLATVLFTDIVDSTAQAAAMGDRAWRATRERHDALTRTQLARFRGREVKTMGDGFLATFDGPARAVRCAQAIVQGVGDLGIEVRAGLHTGEVELDDNDVSGIAVAIGARVGALAGGSEVLVSQTIRDLTAGSGIVYSERGEHQLKGVPERWRLYQVVQ